jgi:hypothetical protein
MSPFRPSSGARGGSESVAIRLAPDSLSASPRQVNRYAGGSRYQPVGARQGLVRAAIATAGQLITPALVYAVHPVASWFPDGSLILHNGLAVQLPLKERDPDTGYVAAIVCTLGPELEETCRQLIRQRKVLEAIFLDAAGTAFLEALSQQAYELLRGRAHSDGLFPGCQFAPGYGTMPMTEQSLLFRLVNAMAIGVQLSRHLIMTPSKSLSFFVTLTNERSSAKNTYKCRACSMKDCRFRLQPGGGPEDRSPRSSRA